MSAAQLYDVNVGDVLTIATHHPQQVTVAGFQYAGYVSGVEMTQLCWKSDDCEGVTALSEGTIVDRLWECPANHLVRQQYEAAQEAALATLLATVKD